MRVDPDVRRLSLGALLLAFGGPKPPRWLLDALEAGLGGVVLFGSNVGDGSAVAALTAQLRAAAGRDLVLALDEEGGDVTRLDTVRGSASPGAAALGYLDDPDVTERAYAAIGERLADAGITVDLAPVADVNVDPRNPVIGVRSFGTDADVVARHVAAAVRGIQSQGVAACVKHFPGHGATSSDTHHELATLHRSRAELDAVEMPPFTAAIRAGTRAVMTGHLLVPALDPDHLVTVSRAVTTGLLRDELGFTGTVVTDALEMRALAGTVGMERGFVAALAAGADAIETGAQEYPELVEALPQAVQRAVDDGSLTFARLEEAARRTAALSKSSAPQHVYAHPRADNFGWARCLEVLGSLPRLDAPLVVECRPPANMASGELPWSLAEPLARRLRGVDHVDVHAAAEAASIAERSADRGLVVVVRDPARHEWQRELLEIATAHPRAVVVDVGWPTEHTAGSAAIRTRGIAPPLLAAAADLLSGARLES